MRLSGKGSDINTPASEDYICFLISILKIFPFVHYMHMYVRVPMHRCGGRRIYRQLPLLLTTLPSWDRVSCWVGRSLAIILAGSRDLPVSALSRLGLQTVMVLGVGVGDSNSGPHDYRAGVYSVSHLSWAPNISSLNPYLKFIKEDTCSIRKQFQYSHLNTIHCVNKPKFNYLTCLCIAFFLEPSQEKQNKTHHEWCNGLAPLISILA